MRALVRAKYRPYQDREILQAETGVAEAILAAIDAKGPLSSLEFEDRQRVGDNNSWYGQTRTKRILRSLWACGLLVTHHRQGGRHYYERPERVIPPHHFQAAPMLDQETYLRWILPRRVQAMGLLLGPLDSMLWDRKTLRYIFDFDSIWEVYKPEHLRRWGYYVLPVFYGDRFIARINSRLEKGIWTISHWWWEDDVVHNEGMLEALRLTIGQFMHYLSPDRVPLPWTKAAL